MRTMLLALLALIGAVACKETTCRDACSEERTDCLDEASSFAEEDKCRGEFEQCELICDDDDGAFAPRDAG